MQLEWILCFTSFILILCHHDLPRKPPRVLIAVDKIYITFISPWIPKAIRISNLIFFIAFSPCHSDQVHIYQTPSKSSVSLCCFAISVIYDRTLNVIVSSIFIFSESIPLLGTSDYYCYYSAGLCSITFSDEGSSSPVDMKNTEDRAVGGSRNKENKCGNSASYARLATYSL